MDSIWRAALSRRSAWVQAASLSRETAPPIVGTMQNQLILTLNGERRVFGAPVTVAGLVAALGLDARKVAVERNEEIVPRSIYSETLLAEGDLLEIVHFIGGG